MSRRLSALIFGALVACTPAFSQYRDGCTVEFGRSFLSFITANDISLPLYRFPSKNVAPFARFTSTLKEVSRYTHIPKFSLEHPAKESVEDLGKRILDLSEASEYALPVLALSPDSTWMKISLDCRIFSNPPSAWVSVSDAKDEGMRIASWSNYFSLHSSVVFLCDSMSVFFAYPDSEFKIARKDLKISTRTSRTMEVLTYSDVWMMVRVTPPVADRDTVWIQYLDKHGRPRVWPIEE